MLFVHPYCRKEYNPHLSLVNVKMFNLFAIHWKSIIYNHLLKSAPRIGLLCKLYCGTNYLRKLSHSSEIFYPTDRILMPKNKTNVSNIF